MKARIVSHAVGGDLRIETVCCCTVCHYGDTDYGGKRGIRIYCESTGQDITAYGEEPENCPFPTLLDVLVAKEG